MCRGVEVFQPMEIDGTNRRLSGQFYGIGVNPDALSTFPAKPRSRMLTHHLARSASKGRVPQTVIFAACELRSSPFSLKKERCLAD